MNQRQKNKYLKFFIHHYWVNPYDTIRNTLYSDISWCNRKGIDRFIKKHIYEADKVQKNGVEISSHSNLKY